VTSGVVNIQRWTHWNTTFWKCFALFNGNYVIIAVMEI